MGLQAWAFDGGTEIAASSAAEVVPLPWSDPACIDPEEALLAALSSCYMLFFLHICAAAGLVVEHYRDEARARLIADGAGRPHVGAIRLRPEVRFVTPVDPAEVEALHAQAHERCFIAASLRSTVRIEPQPAAGVLRGG
ncbi:organic hydroperoxide reductase OsmC/OhrA [Salipiger aestuarii]|uniref:Organic hydroperoxide reductase OsmC/OhrA n=2 Tax=Salipiger aestuarii TaxID=568098 RepID=A0A327XZ99_9RHOB|nr:organic hydroperoxide reductase OsmC/OhrA [Salipiger aestuarii]